MITDNAYLRAGEGAFFKTGDTISAPNGRCLTVIAGDDSGMLLIWNGEKYINYREDMLVQLTNRGVMK